jgi:pimeloyl-ACP methyl ester carboxylesterase
MLSLSLRDPPNVLFTDKIATVITHFLPPRQILEFPESHAVWCRTPPTRVVVFVHGFRGEALETWHRFDELLPEDPSSANFDFLFYGYDGFRSELMASVGAFKGFLERLLTLPSRISNQQLPIHATRPDTHEYNEIMLVGHSLGAVVIRYALLQLRRSKAKNLERIRLAFFAPAHRGAYLAKLMNETLSPIPFLNLFAGLLKFKSPLIEQLLPNSDELQELQRLTEEALKSGENSQSLVAESVFIAKTENIVKNLPFCQDPEPVIIEADHKWICKPLTNDSFCFGHLVNLFNEQAKGTHAGN